MKHTLKITLILVGVFLLAQLVGLAVINQYIDYEKTTQEQLETGNVTWAKLPYGLERPEVEPQFSYIYFIAVILIGTIIMLLLIKWQKPVIWKYWFLFAVAATLTISFGAFPEICPSYNA